MSIHFDLLPKTRNEALQVLGASPKTREEVLKELVRTLRRKWHPDQAREEERPFRERRLKQINVAWDILRNRQATSAFG
jgi:DnaJ-class molecular chaperone